jgi:hypothetical protein
MILAQDMTKAAATKKARLRSLLLISLFAFFILHSAFSCPAQLPPQTENRFLFIINTSAAMRPMTNGIRDAVLGLLQSRMQNQMRDGDSFGIWTYDARLHTDFPMQIWAKDQQAAILQVVTNWLADQRYQNKPHLEKVLPAARQIAAMSRVVTLIFIYDGSELMRDVVFDNDINALQKETGRRTLADHIPFVTVLVARDGKFFDYRVRTPASVSLPLTAQFFPARTNAVAAIVVTNPPPPVVAVTNAPPPVVAAKPPEPRHPEIVLKPSTPPVTNPPPAAVSVPVAQNTVETPQPIIPPAPTPSALSNNTLTVVGTPPSAPPAPAPIPPPSNPTVAAPPPAEMPRQSSPPPAPNLNLNLNLNPNPAIATAPPQPVKPAKTDAQQGLAALAPPGRTAPPATNPWTAVAPSSAPPVAPAAVAIPSASDHVALLLIAFSLVIIAIVLVVFLIRRSRTPPSLITQSMNRPR